jgi:xanthine dehydrogenase accessory factor
MLALFKGAGEFGSAAARRLHLIGFQVVMTERPQPLCVRRKVSFAECVFTTTTEVDQIRGVRASSPTQIQEILAQGAVAVIVDPENKMARRLQPTIMIDARMLKREAATRLDEATVVIGLGPGHVAGENVHAVIETNRGHNLGRVLYQGTAEPNTGLPGPVCGHTTARVLRAPVAGRFEARRHIGDQVAVGEPVGSVSGQVVSAQISGVIRGLLYSGLAVELGTKLGDVDPRAVRQYCFTISDKANAIAGGVVEACLRLLRERGHVDSFV